MKQKLLFILSVSLCLPFFCSCNNNKATIDSDSKVLLYRKENLSSTIMLNSVKQLQDVTRYENCMLYVSLDGCSHCELAKTYLKKYIKENNVVVYEIDRNTYASAYDEKTNFTGTYANMFPKIKGFPAFFFYKDGKLVDSYLNGIESEDDLNTLFSSYTVATNLYLLNDINYSITDDAYCFTNSEELEETKALDLLGFTTDDLDYKISTGEAFNVLYTWRRCSDCKNYRAKVLYPFLYKNKDKKIYVYETDGFMQLKRMSDVEDYENIGLNLWSEFSTKYHLSDYPNIDKNGNTAGYVPTIVSYKSSIDYKISVFANQGNVTRREDGTIHYQQAFYDELKELKSDTIVDEGDKTSSTYQKALKELNKKVLEKDVELNYNFLGENV